MNQRKRIYAISNTESERIDAIKIIMCFAVLMLHAYSSSLETIGTVSAQIVTSITDYISNVICGCAVPAFILISSVLLYSKEFNWKDNAKKKVVNLLIPYFIFNTLWILIMVAKGYILSEPAEYLGYGVLDWIDAYIGIKGSFKPALTVLWYVRDLFILNVIAIPIRKLVDKFPKIIFIVMLVLWFSGVTNIILHTHSLVFWTFGYYIVKYNIRMDVLDKINMKISTAVYVLCAAFTFIIRVGGGQKRICHNIHFIRDNAYKVPYPYE